jgi:hypothetical protein
MSGDLLGIFGEAMNFLPMIEIGLFNMAVNV